MGYWTFTKEECGVMKWYQKEKWDAVCVTNRGMVKIYFNVSLLNSLKNLKKIHTKKSRDYKNLQMAKWIDELTIKKNFYTGKNKNGFLSTVLINTQVNCSKFTQKYYLTSLSK